MKERKKHRSRGKLLDEQDEWMGKEGWQGRCEKGGNRELERKDK